MNKNLFVLIFLAMALLISCGQNNDEIIEPLEAIEVKNIPADPSTDPLTGQPQQPTGKFTLFSLRENKTVANTDSASAKWDIGFRGTTIIVNGGSIRSGNGGAYLFDGLFEELISIPENKTFNTDESPSNLAVPLGSGNGWYNYDPQNNWISPIPGKILVIRNGDGTYSKVELLSYYKDMPSTPNPAAASRYYSFRYMYQPNGSKNF